jgi:hypothetical protein
LKNFTDAQPDERIRIPKSSSQGRNLLVFMDSMIENSTGSASIKLQKEFGETCFRRKNPNSGNPAKTAVR